MGIREEKDMGVMDEYETLRDAYTGKIWNIGDLVEANGSKDELFKEEQTILHTMIVMVKYIKRGCMKLRLMNVHLFALLFKIENLKI